MALSALKPRSFTGKRGEPKKASLRPDIQGLRAFAVIVVILDHLIHWPHAGYIGVDVFFVISGFLITGHLLREYDRTGHISFVSFYKKRAKRILPAATLVLAATVGAALALLNTARYNETLWDAIWGFFFAANWRFGALGTDYFQVDGPISPLQHFWSLAVEEQFYFVWPWLLLLTFFLCFRGRMVTEKQVHLVAGIAIGIITVTSLAWAVAESASNPGFAYFSTFSRAWELGIGAAAACAIPALSRIPAALRPTLAWIGIAGLAASLIVVDSTAGFPAPWAALPILSTALVIAAGTGSPAHRSLAVLTNPVAGYLGNISYSLYLWHFPVIVIAGALIKEKGWAYYAILLAVIFMVSAFAFHLWEDPIRKSGWLTGDKKWIKHTEISTGYKLTAVAFLAVIAFSVAGLALAHPNRVTAVQEPTPKISLGDTPTAAPTYSPEVTAIQKGLQAAARQSSWPALSPSVENLGTDTWGKEIQKVTCTDVRKDNLQKCFFPTPGATKTAVLYGDSFAMAWSPGVKAALSSSGYNLQMLTRAQCPAATISVTGNGGQPFPECDEQHDWAASVIQGMKPDLLIMASAENTLRRMASGKTGAEAVAEYDAGMKTALESLMPSAGATVVLSSPPGGQNLQECVTNISKPADCATTVLPEWRSFIEKERAVAEAAKAKYVDSELWFCADSGVCPAFVGNTPIRVDTGHMTIEYATSLAPALKAALLSGP